MEIFEKLHNKFSKNLIVAKASQVELLKEAEFKAQFIFNIGTCLYEKGGSKTEAEIAKIFDEIFSDLTISIYLSLCSISTGSNIILRRVLELGISILYFWDMPHKFWGWKTISTHESDLSFKDNLEYLGSTPYKTYLQNEFEISDWGIDKEKVNALYRQLSNAIHGKFDTFETMSSESYDFIIDDYTENLQKIIHCENILLKCFQIRFNNEYKFVSEKKPAINLFKNGY